MGKMEQWAGEWLARQHGLLLPWLAICMGAGVAGYFALTFEPTAVQAEALFVGAALVVGSLGRWRSNMRAVAFCGALCLLMGAAGFGLARMRTVWVAAPVLAQEIEHAEVEGTVKSINLLEEGKGLRLLLGDVRIEGLDAAATPKQVRIKVRHAPDVHVGQKVHVLAGLNPPGGPIAPGAFDFQRYAWFRQIGAFGFSYSDPVVIDARIPGGDYAQKARTAIGEHVGGALTGPEAAMSIAMMNGEVSSVAEDDWDAMRDSGLAHILAISGSHVTVLAGFVFFLVRALLAFFPRVALYWPVKKISAVAALVAAALYVWMVGPLIPIVRAWLMTDIILLAVLVDRVPISLNLLAFSALAVMAVWPEQALGPSFQMSYAAVAALILFYECTRAWWRRVYGGAGILKKAGLYLLGILGTSFAAEMAVAPLALYHFQQFTIYGLVANILAAPVLSFIVMPAVVVVFMTLPFGLEYWPVKMLGFGDGVILKIAHMVAGWPHAAFHFAAWPAGAVVVLFLGACCLFGLRGRARWSFVPLMVIAGMMIAAHRQPDVLVAPSGKLVAIRMKDGTLALSNRRSERFAADNWMQLAGLQDEEPMKWPKEGALEDLSCDEFGCRLERGRVKIGFPKGEEGQAADCAWADIVVSQEPVSGECRARVIDADTLQKSGATAIWADGRIKTVADTRGVRPWAVSNTR